MIGYEVSDRLLIHAILMNLILQLAQVKLYLGEPLERHHGSTANAFTLRAIVLLESYLIRSYLLIGRELLRLNLCPRKLVRVYRVWIRILINGHWVSVFHKSGHKMLFFAAKLEGLGHWREIATHWFTLESSRCSLISPWAYMDLLNGLLDLTQLILQLTLLEAHIIQLFDNHLLGISNFPESIIDTVLILLNLLDLHGLRLDDGFPISDLLMQLGDDVLCPLHLTVYRFLQAPLFLVLHQVIANNIAPLHLF